MSGIPFSFADAFARQARQRLEQELPTARGQAHPMEANENLLQVSPEEGSSDGAVERRDRPQKTAQT